MHGTAKELPKAAALHGRLVPLDAMRGVAALLVVAYHFSAHLGGWEPKFGYLAVDLFFVLSGFVIAHVYDPRFAAGMTVRSFMARRILRLAPLFLLGWAIGICALLAVPDPRLTGVRLPITVALNLFGLPSPFTAEGSFSLFGVNRPFWSLFFELWVANLGFAIFWRQLRGLTLYAVVIISAVALLYAEKHFHTLGLGVNPSNFLFGLPRVGFSFCAGILVARFHRASRAPYAVPSVLCLVAAGALLCVNLQGKIGYAYELGCVFFAFPLLVYVGASAKETLGRFSEFLGDLSYAGYTIHFPILLMLAAYAPAALRGHSFRTELLFVLAIAVAAIIAAKADERVRRRLTPMIFAKARPALNS